MGTPYQFGVGEELFLADAQTRGTPRRAKAFHADVHERMPQAESRRALRLLQRRPRVRLASTGSARRPAWKARKPSGQIAGPNTSVVNSSTVKC